MKPALLLIMLLSFELFGQTQLRPTVKVFEGARLIMGNGAALIESSAFIVENDRFTSVGRKGELRLPSGAAHVDLNDRSCGLHRGCPFYSSVREAGPGDRTHTLCLKM